MRTPVAGLYRCFGLVGHIHGAIRIRAVRHEDNEAVSENRVGILAELFRELPHEYASGVLHKPFNTEARLQAGFDAEELESLLEAAG